MERRRDDVYWSGSDRREVAVRDVDRIPDGVARLVLEEDARRLDALRDEHVCHRRGLAPLRPAADAVAARADDRRVRMSTGEARGRYRTRERGRRRRSVRPHAAAEHDDELAVAVEQVVHARSSAMSTGRFASDDRYAAIATSSARRPASPSIGTGRP